MASALDFISETREGAVLHAASFRAALRYMQRTQDKHARIVCSRCGAPLIAWDQKHVTEGRACSFCVELARLVVIADKAGLFDRV